MMFVPSVEAATVTIRLLNEYKSDESLEDTLKPDFEFCTPEDFLKEHFAKNKYSDETQDHVTELFFRISKHRKFLESVQKGFMSSKNASPDDQPSVYLVFLYLLILELNEITQKSIEDLLRKINLKKALLLLTFLKKPCTLVKLYNWGIKIWDVEYVKCMLCNVINRPLFGEVYETLTSETQKFKKPQTKKITVPVGPKCLNRTKKFVSPAETVLGVTVRPPITRIPVRIKAKLIPPSTHYKPVQLEMIEKSRLKNRDRAEKLYQEAQKKAFKCAYVDKSEKLKKLQEKIEKERWNATIKRRQPRKIKTTTVVEPRKTAAVILREGARLMKLEEEEIKRYEDLAQGGFNSDLLAEWEEEMREEEFRKHLEEIEKKHLEGLLSYEDALIAKKKCLQKKKESAIEFRREKETWINQLEEWRKEEQMRIQQSVEKGKAYEKGAKEAVEHLKEEKHKLALETMEESRALKERWLKEKEEDLQKKVQLIKEIKALHAIGALRRKDTDFTETSNMGLLYEMSLAELKERLFLMKIELREELEKRRAEIKMKRKCRKDIVDSYQELIESYQKITKERKAQKMAECGNGKEKLRLRSSSSSLDSLRCKLYEKRKERVQCLIPE